jgi:Tfp pilus assembly protein PilO
VKQLWQRFSQRERALVVVTVVILLVVLGRISVVNPYMARREWVQTQLEIQPQLLEKNLRYIGQKEQLNAALESARNDIKARETKLLTGDTPSVNASDLQETVQAMAVKEGTQVITTRVLNPEPTGAFSKIAIQMEVGGQVDQVATLVRGIETSPKLLVIDEINVRSLFRPTGIAQQGAPQVPAQNLRVSITVAGFARGQASAGKPDASKDAKLEKGV